MDTNTDDLIGTLMLRCKQMQRAEDILMIDRSAKNAAALKKAQRYERQALTALDRHLKQCIKEHKRQLADLRRDALAEMKNMEETHSYRPTRRGLKKMRGS